MGWGDFSSSVRLVKGKGGKERVWKGQLLFITSVSHKNQDS